MCRLYTCLLITALALVLPSAQGQSFSTIILSEDSSIQVKPSFRFQTWARYTRANPGTTVYGEAKEHIFDVSLRRVRLGLSGKAGRKMAFQFNLGGNNLNYISGRNFSIRVLDAHIDYRLAKWLQVGLGKSNWHAASRADSRSTTSILALDAPVFTLSTVNHADDLIRLLGVYAKGQLLKFDYRIGVHNTYSVQNTPAYSGRISDIVAGYSNAAPKLRYSAYLKYHFLEEESNKTPFNATANLGKKKILSIGMGAKNQNDLMWTQSAAGDTVYHDLRQWAFDVFYDAPLRNGDAFTAYFTYVDLMQGPNYIRNIGLNNPATGLDSATGSFSGRGNAFPMMGSGETLFLQLGYFFSHGFMGEGQGQLQPSLSIQHTRFKFLSDPVIAYDAGLNFFLRGHNSKFTLNYQSRPIFYQRSNGIFSEERRGMWVMQYQLAM